MSKHYQMQMTELLQDSFRPRVEPMHMGSWAYMCPVCGAAVGIRTITDGFIYQREACENDHKVDWTEV